jgi:putative tryptophan/tyrosine transport system substrate-binding protein
LELLKEIVPKLSRVAVVASSRSADHALVAKELELAAERLGLKIQHIDIAKLDPQTAFRDAGSGQAEAVLFRVPGPILNPRRTEIVALALKSRLPVIYESEQEVEAGGLLSYGLNSKELYRRAATYVDKILKGAKPADLPVEQPTKFELVFNLKTAKQIGLRIPANVLARADKVIK